MGLKKEIIWLYLNYFSKIIILFFIFFKLKE